MFVGGQDTSALSLQTSSYCSRAFLALAMFGFRAGLLVFQPEPTLSQSRQNLSQYILNPNQPNSHRPTNTPEITNLSSPHSQHPLEILYTPTDHKVTEHQARALWVGISMSCRASGKGGYAEPQLARDQKRRLCHARWFGLVWKQRASCRGYMGSHPQLGLARGSEFAPKLGARRMFLRTEGDLSRTAKARSKFRPVGCWLPGVCFCAGHCSGVPTCRPGPLARCGCGSTPMLPCWGRCTFTGGTGF